MSKQAKITSVKAIDTFRAAVVQFRSRTMRGVSGVYQDVRRMQHWVESEQPLVWRQRIRKAQAALDNARSDLERARISRPNDTAQMFFEQRKAMERARAKQREAEERLELLKKWSRRIDHQSNLLRAGLQPLTNMLEADMELLVARLNVLTKHLDSYLKLPTPPADFDAWAREMGETISPFSRGTEIDESEESTEDDEPATETPEPAEDDTP
ncbi:MAG: hypothetical protein MK116_05875 [Phycisphaerales bacterium]|nr:hypothetical protein [Phycisphaerales bacterium]